MQSSAKDLGRVLIVDDEADTAYVIAELLTDAGCVTQTVTNPREALGRFEAFGPDLVTLDVIMAGLDGVSLCLAIRARSSVPILFVSAMAAAHDRVVGLRIGADDYLTKPFDNDELVARVTAILRRSALRRANRAELRVGDLVLDRGAKQVRYGERVLPVTPSQFTLLQTLAAAPGRVFVRSELLAEPASYARGEATRAIDVAISRLRRTFEEAQVREVVLETVRGFGYRLAPVGERSGEAAGAPAD